MSPADTLPPSPKLFSRHTSDAYLASGTILAKDNEVMMGERVERIGGNENDVGKRQITKVPQTAGARLNPYW